MVHRHLGPTASRPVDGSGEPHPACESSVPATRLQRDAGLRWRLAGVDLDLEPQGNHRRRLLEDLHQRPRQDEGCSTLASCGQGARLRQCVIAASGITLHLARGR